MPVSIKMTQATQPIPLLFKVLVDGKSCHGGDHSYVLGEWTRRRKPKVCCCGWHLTSDPLRWWRPNAELYVAEGRGTIDWGEDDKAAFASVRLVAKITRRWKYLPMFPRIRAFLAASERSRDPNCDISWANLHGADLHEADLHGADLHGADLGEANLSGANLGWAYRPTEPTDGWKADKEGRLIKV